MGIGIKELLVILVIVVIVFGTKRFSSMGGDLGEAIKGFRKAMKDEDKEDKKPDGLSKDAVDDSADNEKTP